MNLTRVTMAFAAVLLASSAWAQGVYVGGAIAAEVVRTTSTKSGGTTYDNGSGEAFGGAIRVGTFITERVGVELEYFRSGELESGGSGPIYLAAERAGVFPGMFPIDPSLPTALIYPSIISQTTRVRTSTSSALLTARQSLGSRVDIVYLGGVGFSRVSRELEYGFPRGVFPVDARIQSAYSERSTQYGAGPVVGVEVRAGMTQHAQLVAGLRMHTVGQALVDGWMIRPSVGLTWRF